MTSIDPNSITESFDRTVSSAPSDVLAYKIGSDVYKFQVNSFSASEFSVSGTFQVAQINLPVIAPTAANVLMQTLILSSATHAYLTGVTDFNSVASYDPNLVTSTWNRTFESSPFDVMVFKSGEDLYKFQLLSLPADETSSGSFQYASILAVPEPSTWVMGLAGIACGGWQMWRRRRTR